ncbi:MAG: type II glyceraldehyde-3-phosphate dehydrogenase [Candidatus Altiarchaeota archaeon]
MDKIKVGINGYGTIGKRVADAVNLQDDMVVSGVTKTKPDWIAKLAVKKGFRIYGAIPEAVENFKKEKVPMQGTIEDLVKASDLIVDCSPGKKSGEKNKEDYYKKAKIKAIFQGGEKAHIADVSFSALRNYDQAINKDYVRVVSCNTTGLCRTLGAVKDSFGIKKARVILIRRGPDPGNTKSGPVNAIVPNPVTVPSHHGPDVVTVMPDLNIVTVGFVVPTTLMHLQTLMVELKKDAKSEDVIKTFEKTRRVRLVSADEGLTSTAQIMELARDLYGPRSDMMEICVWRESVNVKGGELYYTQAIHQESDVVPENIDAIRAMFNLMPAEKSIEKTDRALGIPEPMIT